MPGGHSPFGAVHRGYGSSRTNSASLELVTPLSTNRPQGLSGAYCAVHKTIHQWTSAIPQRHGGLQKDFKGRLFSAQSSQAIQGRACIVWSLAERDSVGETSLLQRVEPWLFYYSIRRLLLVSRLVRVLSSLRGKVF